MVTKFLGSPKFRFSTITLFLKEHLAGFPQLSYQTPLQFQKYFNNLFKLVRGYEEIILDEDGTILTWNQDFQKINGYREDEIIGQSLNLLYLPQHRQLKLAEQLIHSASSHGTATQFGQFVRKDGSTFWGSLKIVAIRRSKELLGFVALAREVSGGEIE